jgi:hypothetical protein
LVSYECVVHKERFVRAYLEAVNNATTNNDVKQLAKYLMKPTARTQRNVEYDEDAMKSLLKKPDVVAELKEINRNFIANSQYVNKVEEIVANLQVNKLQLEQPRQVEPQPLEPQEHVESPTITPPISSKTREMFKSSNISTSYFNGKTPSVSKFGEFKDKFKSVVQASIVESPSSSFQSNDLKKAFIDSITTRYQNYNMTELGDYRARIDEVLETLDKLENPSRETIISTIGEWYSTLPAEQQYQFKGEMPMMVEDSPPKSIVSVSPR